MWSLKVKPLKINRMYKNMFRYNDEKQANKNFHHHHKVDVLTRFVEERALDLHQTFASLLFRPPSEFEAGWLRELFQLRGGNSGGKRMWGEVSSLKNGDGCAQSGTGCRKELLLSPPSALHRHTLLRYSWGISRGIYSGKNHGKYSIYCLLSHWGKFPTSSN